MLPQARHGCRGHLIFGLAGQHQRQQNLIAHHLEDEMGDGVSETTGLVRAGILKVLGLGSASQWGAATHTSDVLINLYHVGLASALTLLLK